MTLHGLRCHACGSPDLIAVAPGHECARFADLFIVERELPERAFCAACWPSRAADISRIGRAITQETS